MKYILLLILFASCVKTKEYIQKPTCYHFLVLSDKYDGEMIYLRTDTLNTQWEQTSGTLTNYVCNDDTAMFYKVNPLVGCESGWQRFRYIKSN